jgi:2-phospho-L-lactate guanylyltransferase (CobY/MobA/RfbA family)
MVRIVVPFRGLGAKTRLGLGPEFAQAMLADVVAAAGAVGEVRIATGMGGQGEAIAAELERLPRAPVLIVNADLPCVTPRDLLALLGSAQPGGIALVEAADGTTNALALSDAGQFADLYGPGSAARFRRHAAEIGARCVTAAIPNIVDDVDTVEDLGRVESRLGRHTATALTSLRDVA